MNFNKKNLEIIALILRKYASDTANTDVAQLAYQIETTATWMGRVDTVRFTKGN
jgi:hypothetical protein